MGQAATRSSSEIAGRGWRVYDHAAQDSPGLARLIPGSQRGVPIDRPSFTGAVTQFSRQALAKIAPASFRQISPSQLGPMLMDLATLGAAAAFSAPLLAPVLGLRAGFAYVVVALAVSAQEGLYRDDKKAVSDQFLLGKASIWAFALVALASGRSGRGAAAIALLCVTGLCVTSAWRWIWGRVRPPCSSRVANVLVVGNPIAMQKVAAAIRSDSALRCIKGLVPDRQFRNTSDSGLLGRIVREEHIDEVVIAGGDPDFVEAVVNQCCRSGIDVTVSPELAQGKAVGLDSLGGIPLIKVHERRAPDWELAVKRVLDVLLGSILVALALPAMCAMGIAIKVDSRGPILYTSERVGRKGRGFFCFKFRTMYPNADRAKPGLRSENDRQGAFFKMSDDPRTTRVGRWLRRYSLDELPQLWNVLRGDMSLVGPRPHPVDDVERYELGDLQRLDFTPGMTGQWQVIARNDPSFKKCVALDVEYINRWSLLLDFQILGKTVAAVLRGSGT